MSQPKGLRINVAAPCNENWDDMSREKNGRYCSNCKKVVVDFSNLNDQQLYKYFSEVGIVPCGRFRNDQLEKKIVPYKNRRPLFNNIYKAVAAFLAIVAIRHPSIAGNKKANTVEIVPYSSFNNNFAKQDSGKVIINGTVKNEQGLPLQNAEIKFGELVSLKTDAEGKFEFVFMDGREIKSTILQISYPGLIREIRSYHHTMLSTSFNITLYKPELSCFHTMGIPFINDTLVFPPRVIDCSKSDFLTNDLKAYIATLAVKLRNYPTAIVSIVAYAGKKNTKSRSMSFQKGLKAYFIEKEGISEDRFKLIVEKEFPKKQNLLEIKVSTEY